MFNNKFNLYPLNEAASHSIVVNVNELEYFTWIELPHDIAKFLSLYNIQEFNTPTGPVNVDYVGKLTRDCLRPWLRIESSLLNVECGFHMYKLQFIDTRTGDTFSLYFAYNLQNDNPDKTSYIYMDGRNAEGYNPFDTSEDSDGSDEDFGSNSDSNSDNNPDDSDNSSADSGNTDSSDNKPCKLSKCKYKYKCPANCSSCTHSVCEECTYGKCVYQWDGE